MPSEQFLALERRLSGAHRATWACYYRADHLGMPLIADRLYRIALELAELQETLLKPRKRPPTSSSDRAYQYPRIDGDRSTTG